jgi:hypothetical protein
MSRSRSWKRWFRSLDVTEHGCTVAPLPKYYMRFWVVLAAGATVFVLFSPTGGALIRIGAGILLALCAFSVEGEARVGIVFTERGVLVRNWWRHLTVDWSHFKGFEVPTPKLGYRVGRLRTTDGRSIRCSILTPYPRIGRGEPAIERAVEALNDVAAGLRASQNDRFGLS